MLAVPPPNAATSATAWLSQTCNWDFKTLSPSDKRINFKVFKSAVVAWMLQTNLPEFDNPLEFMGYAVAVLDAAQFQAVFPGSAIVAAPAPPVFPGGSPNDCRPCSVRSIPEKITTK